MNHPAPAVAVGGAFEIRRDKFPHRPVVHARLEAEFGFGARLQAREIEFVHRGKLRPMRHPEIIFRRDIDDDQTRDALGLPTREEHRNLPAHAVTEECDPRQALRIEPRDHVAGHRGVGHLIMMR